MYSWVWWRPVVVGAASAFDLAGRTISESRSTLRSEGALRRVLYGQLGTFALAASALGVGAALILSGVPEGGFVAVLGPLSAPSLAVLARSEVAPSRPRLSFHLATVFAVAALLTALICFFDAGRVSSALVFGSLALLLGVVAALSLFAARRAPVSPPAPPSPSDAVAADLDLLSEQDPAVLERLRREAWRSPE